MSVSSRIPQVLPLSKSDYLVYLACPPEFWYLKHQPERFHTPPDEETLFTMQQGMAVEKLARGYSYRQTAANPEFQRNFENDILQARADVVLTDPHSGRLTLIEVKSGTGLKEEYLHDLAFQVITAEACGHQVGHAGVLHVKNDYVLDGTLDPQQFFTYLDVTAEVGKLLPETRQRIDAALTYLRQDAPAMTLHQFCDKKLACPVIQLQHPRLPHYTIFDINRLGRTKLVDLLQQNILSVHDVPDAYTLSAAQRRQVTVAKNGNAHVDTAAIRRALDRLCFPLYFLDYESLNTAIPLYSGIRPYQQMVFQWSLHVLERPDAPLRHLEFLGDGRGRPTLEFAAALRAAIPDDGGSVVVWNQSFETARNREMAALHPEFAAFFQNINDRVFDLMDIFQRQDFAHPATKGSYSIKQVLPVLAPQRSYDGLAIAHGGLAAIRWFQLATGAIPESARDQTLQDLRAYCHLDTLAMVEIYRALTEMVR